MLNDYEVAEIVEIGKAHDVILGNPKLNPVIDESPVQEWRDPFSTEDD